MSCDILIKVNKFVLSFCDDTVVIVFFFVCLFVCLFLLINVIFLHINVIFS